MDRNRPERPPTGAAVPCVTRTPREPADGIPHVHVRGSRTQTLNPMALDVPAPYGASLVTGLTDQGLMLPLGQADYGKSQLIKGAVLLGFRGYGKSRIGTFPRGAGGAA